MTYLRSSEAQIARLLAVRHGGPVRMLNLIRYAGETGPERYARYYRAAGEILKQIGARVLYDGEVLCGVVGPEDERWDRMVLVEYPSLKVFLTMSRSKEFLAINQWRLEALADHRLIALA